MAQIDWTPAMEVGVEQIDADHRVLVELLNRVDRASELSDTAAAISALQELERYTTYHFELEEHLMMEHEFEFADAHRKEHRELFYEVKHQLDDLLDGETTLANVTVFMQRWLLRHIAGSDRLLGEALLRRRATMPTARIGET